MRGVRVLYLARAELERDGLATRTGGDGRRGVWRRRCVAWERAGGSGVACGGGGELRGDPFYRASEAVEGGVRRWQLGGRRGAP